jgi:hypothetical protein
VRTLLLVLCLVWAGLHSAVHGSFASNAQRAPELTRRSEVALLAGVCAPRLRLVEARDPPLVPTLDLPPFWSVLPGRVGVPLGARPSHLLASAIETTDVHRTLSGARSSRGPPRLGV